MPTTSPCHGNIDSLASTSHTRRYYGNEPWPTGEHNYDASVHADDLASLIRSLDARAVYPLTRSSGAYYAVITAVKYP